MHLPVHARRAIVAAASLVLVAAGTASADVTLMPLNTGDGGGRNVTPGAGAAGEELNQAPSASGVIRNLGHSINNQGLVVGDIAVDAVSLGGGPSEYSGYLGTNAALSANWLGDTLGSAGKSYMSGVNNSGNWIAVLDSKPYRNVGGTTVALDVPTTSFGALAGVHGINDSNDAVGVLLNTTPSWRPVKWAAGGTSYVEITAHASTPNVVDNNSNANDINNVGQIVGSGNWGTTAFITAPGSTQAVQIPNPALDPQGLIAIGGTHLEAVNNGGRAVGMAHDFYRSVGVPIAFKPTTANSTSGVSVALDSINTPTGTMGIGTGNNDANGSAYDINDAGLAVGHIVGNTSASADWWLGQWWLGQYGTGQTGLEGSSEAFLTSRANPDSRAFIWDTDGAIGTDLETYLSVADQGIYDLVAAVSINNNNDVLVLYKLHSEITNLGFADAPMYSGVMAAVPEPASVAGFGALLGMLLRRRR